MRILVDPAFRSIAEIFSEDDLARLNSLGEVVWARDDAMPSDQFLAEAGMVDAIVFGAWRSGPAGLDAILAGRRRPALLEVAGGHGHDLDYARCLRAGLLIGSCAPAFADVVAEMGLALALGSARGVVAADRAVQKGREAWLHEGNVDNRTLLGSTVGFVGCGGISRSLQRMLEPFGVTVLGHDPPIPESMLIERGIEPVGLDEMFARSRVVFILAAPTPENHNLIGRDLMAGLNVNQSLVVLSRGHLVDFDALTELAAAGRFKAASDVYPTEPLEADSPLRDLGNVITVPHLAGALPEALLDIGRRVVDDLETLAENGTPTALQYLTEANFSGLRQPG